MKARMLSHRCLRNKPQNLNALLYNGPACICATGVIALSKKDPFSEEYGRHSSFRPEPRYAANGLSVVKSLFVMFALVFAVLGYERWQGLEDKVSPPVQTVAQPSVATSEEPEPEPASAEAQADDAVTELPAAPVKLPPAEESPALSDGEEASPIIEQYVMDKNPHSNSFMGLGSINGVDVTLLVDTGASVVVVPERIARRIGLKKGAEMAFSTGGGRVSHYSTTLDRLTLGRIELRSVDAAINPAMQQDFVLLGMSALGLMDMQVEQGRLVLKYKQAVTAHDIAVVEPFKRTSKDCVSHGNKFDQQTLDCLKGR